MKRLIALSLSFSLVVICFGKLDKESLALVNDLKELYSRFDELSENHHAHIDSLRSIVESFTPGTADMDALDKLGDAYVEQNLDSAMFYWHMAQQEAIVRNDTSENLRLEFKMLSFLPYQGLGLDAAHRLESVDYAQLPDSLRKEYWESKTRVYTTLKDFQQPGLLKEDSRRKAIECLDSLSHYFPEGSPVSSYILSILHYTGGEEHLAVANISQLLPYIENTSMLYELALSRMAEYYRDKPQNRQEYVYRVFQLTKNGAAA